MRKDASKDRQHRRPATWVVAPVAVLISLTASCSAQDAPASTRFDSSRVPASVDSVLPGTSGSGRLNTIKTTMEEALTRLASTTPHVEREALRATLIGLDPETADTVEVSISTTPTGLDVESVQGALMISGECVIAEIRAGKVTTTVLPALKNSHCFVGDQR